MDFFIRIIKMIDNSNVDESYRKDYYLVGF